MSDAVDLAFGEDGLVPAVAQDAETGAVLMLAYASPGAVERTLETGEAHYYSRSRDELWHKGATSGHVQRVEEVRVDCDGDALLYRVDQEGGACHTGYGSCFHRAVDGVQEGDGVESVEETDTGTSESPDPSDDSTVRVDVETVGEEVFDPDAVYD